MSKKFIAFSVLSLCLFLFGCWSKDSNVNNTEECLDGDTCQEITVTDEASDKSSEEKNEDVSAIESDIDWFNDISDEITVAEKLDWEPIMIAWEGRED